MGHARGLSRGAVRSRSRGSAPGARSPRYVYSFGNGHAVAPRAAATPAALRELLGGKGAGLFEMTRLDIAVPPGFTITTEAWVAYVAGGKKQPPGLWPQVLEGLSRLEASAGARFGDASRPLLVSVRSGSRVSMPGMMDTVLNLGLNDKTVDGLARWSKNERFAWDCYRRFLTIFGDVVLGLDRQLFERPLDEAKAQAGVTHGRRGAGRRPARAGRPVQGDRRRAERAALPAGSRRAAAAGHQRGLQLLVRQEGRRLPPHQSACPTTGAPRSRSWPWCSATSATARARASASPAIPPPASGASSGSSLPNAQGEDVVAGIRTPEPLAALESAHAQGVPRTGQAQGQARAPLPGHAGHRVHRAGGEALPAPDALGQADGRGGSADRGGDGARGPARRPAPGQGGPLARGEAPGPAPGGAQLPSPAPPPGGGSRRPVHGADPGARRHAGGRGRPGRLLARQGGGGRASREATTGDPRPHGNLAGRRGRHARGRGRAHLARRADLPRRGGGARHGQAVRGRGLGRHGGRGARVVPSRTDHGARGPVDLPHREGRGCARASAAPGPRAVRRVPGDPHVDPRGQHHEGPGQRRHPGRCPEGPGVRGGGDRPGPHRAHVLRGGAHPDRARDDPGRRSPPGGSGPWIGSCHSSARTSRGSSPPWTAFR